MASIGKIKIGKKFESCRSDSCIRDRDNVEYTEPLTLNGKEILQYTYDDFDNRYWVEPSMKEKIIAMSKNFFETTGRSLVYPIPSNPKAITVKNIEDAYVYSLIHELKMLSRHEKEFKKLVKQGCIAVGFKASAYAKGYKGSDDVESLKKQMTKDEIGERWQYFSVKDFELFKDYDWEQPVNLSLQDMIPKQDSEETPLLSKFRTTESALRGVTFDDVLAAILANKSEVNEEVVRKVFQQIAKERIEDAESIIEKQMGNILNAVKKYKN